eukprot:9779910-Alexandrium_andersonii.AAC.1
MEFWGRSHVAPGASMAFPLVVPHEGPACSSGEPLRFSYSSSGFPCMGLTWDVRGNHVACPWHVHGVPSV